MFSNKNQNPSSIINPVVEQDENHKFAKLREAFQYRRSSRLREWVGQFGVNHHCIKLGTLLFPVFKTLERPRCKSVNQIKNKMMRTIVLEYESLQNWIIFIWGQCWDSYSNTVLYAGNLINVLDRSTCQVASFAENGAPAVSDQPIVDTIPQRPGLCETRGSLDAIRKSLPSFKQTGSFFSGKCH